MNIMSKNKTKDINELVRKPQLYLGVATLIVVGIFVAKATYKPVEKKSLSIISPTKAIEAKQAITPKIEVKKSIEQIKKFADTGAIEIVVKEGDNFWKIAKQVCGNGVFADSIKEKNGYRNQSLQPGDTLIVSCD